MSNEQTKELCLSLLKAEDENSVIAILKKYGYWDNEDSWMYYGNNENNFSTIGNQQSAPEAALVEKLINSVDAVLMKECWKTGIRPDSHDSPRSLEEALVKYFSIYKGSLTGIDTKIRGELANNISLIASGGKTNPCYIIYDKGEGQTPNTIPNTFLSISESNKLRIPFVQGKFNMGSTGSLQFCGTSGNNLQLIISKRSIDIPSNVANDDSKDYWGFTIIRREDPKQGMRSSAYKYLAPNGKILRFLSTKISALPDNSGETYQNDVEDGSIVKLYEYQFPGGLKTNIKLDLYYKLSLLLPNLALPISLYETRPYRQQSPKSIMSGLSVRLDEDKGDNIESDEYPSSSELQVLGEKAKVLIYAFKKDQANRYTLGQGIIFTVNGQTHATIPSTFFQRKNVGMSQLSDSLLVIVDCTKFNKRTIEDLFMNSRDRLRDGEIRAEIIRQLEDIIHNHPGLKELREKRRREALTDMLKDSKPLADVLNKIIKKSPTLTRLFTQGLEIQNPFNLTGTSTQGKFIGKQYPTFFKLSKEYSTDKPKYCQIDRKFRMQFITDATNDYFNRDLNPASFQLDWDGVAIETFSHNLWNGICTVSVTLPECVVIGDSLTLKSVVSDEVNIEPFTSEFTIKIVEKKRTEGGESPEPTDTPNTDPGTDKSNSSKLSLPHIQECRLEEGDDHFLNDKEGALKVFDQGDEGWDFYINMDNVHLKTEMKGDSKTDPRLLESRYKYGMVLIGISCINAWDKEDSPEIDDSQITPAQKIYEFTKAISPILLPMVSGLGDIQIEE